MRSRDELVRKMLDVDDEVSRVSVALLARDWEETVRKVRALAILEGKLELLQWFLISDERRIDA